MHVNGTYRQQKGRGKSNERIKQTFAKQVERRDSEYAEQRRKNTGIEVADEQLVQIVVEQGKKWRVGI
jgi:hypothetical protein